jgi:7-cyano-7-deazaguanine synthase in queuosine biosynthesis
MRKPPSADVTDPTLSAVTEVTPPTRKRVAIFFSGGIDSTYLLCDALCKGHDVYLIYANGSQSPIKAAAEKYARHQIIEALTKMKLPGNIVSDTSIDVTESIRAPVGSWTMTYYWFMSATQVIYHHRVDEIWLGVIWGDELWGVAGFMSSAWSNLMSAIYPVTPASEQPKLIYPIAYMSKYQLRKDLPEKLLKLTWYCEMPRFFRNKPKACGECLPCLKRKLDDKLVAEERTMATHLKEDLPRFRAFEKKIADSAPRLPAAEKKRTRKSRAAL